MIEKMAMLFSGDEVYVMGLAIKRCFENIRDVRDGKVSTPEIDDKEIKSMLADGETQAIDAVVLQDVAERIMAIEELRNENLVYLSWEEFREIHTVLACALSRSCEQVNEGRESPSLEDVREHDLLSAIAERFDRIHDENWK